MPVARRGMSGSPAAWLPAMACNFSIITDMSRREPGPANQEYEGLKTDEGFSQFVARIFGQLSRSSWLPAIMLVGNLVLLFQLRARRNLDFGQATVVFANQPLGFLIVLIFSAVVVNIMTQSFETEVLRLLEGHWGSKWFIRGIASLMTRRQLRNYRKLGALLDHYSRKAFEIARVNMIRQGIPANVMNVLERIARREEIKGVDREVLEKLAISNGVATPSLNPYVGWITLHPSCGNTQWLAVYCLQSSAILSEPARILLAQPSVNFRYGAIH
jgi:hypothetical protein